MLRIRLTRAGKKNQPSFKVVVIDRRSSSTGGRPVEIVGFYNPLTKEKGLKEERIKHWISVGAKPTGTVYNLLISEGIIKGEKVDVSPHQVPEPEEKQEASQKTSEKEAASEEKSEEKSEEEKPEEKEEKKEAEEPEEKEKKEDQKSEEKKEEPEEKEDSSEKSDEEDQKEEKKE